MGYLKAGEDGYVYKWNSVVRRYELFSLEGRLLVVGINGFVFIEDETLIKADGIAVGGRPATNNNGYVVRAATRNGNGFIEGMLYDSMQFKRFEDYGMPPYPADEDDFGRI